MSHSFSLIAGGAVVFRGSYDQCLAAAVDRGLAESERRISWSGDSFDRVRLAQGVHMTLTSCEWRFQARRAA